MKKYHDGHELEFGCHDGKCWAYCGASWTRYSSGFFDSSFFHCRADTQSIDFDSVVTTILVANGARPACMATMVKQADASPTAIALTKSIIVLDHAPFSIKCNKLFSF